MERHPIDVDVGARLKAARSAAGLSGHALADKTKMRRGSISSYEVGCVGVPVGKLADLASAIGVPLIELIPTSDEGAPEVDGYLVQATKKLRALNGKQRAAVYAIINLLAESDD